MDMIFIVELLAVLLIFVTFASSVPGFFKDAQGYDGKEATDPVLLSKLTIDIEKSTHLTVHGGQKIFFASKESMAAFVASPRIYWMSPFDALQSPKGAPDVRNFTMLCPSSGEEMTIDMQTPRIYMRNGQALYFCCWGCLSTFWNDPQSFFVDH